MFHSTKNVAPSGTNGRTPTSNPNPSAAPRGESNRPTMHKSNPNSTPRDLLPLFDAPKPTSVLMNTLTLIIATTGGNNVFADDAVAVRTREIVADCCRQHGWHLQSVATAPSFISVRLSVPITNGTENVVRVLKAATRRRLVAEFPEVRQLSGLWRWGHFEAGTNYFDFEQFEIFLLGLGRRQRR